MPQLVSVKMKFNPKPLWFDPKGRAYESGTEVLVETERGREVGIIHNPSIEATDKEINKLSTPLKPVIRELSDLDFEHIEALEEKGRNAMPIFRDMIEKYELDIKPVEVQYLFSGERAIFYFSSEERIDFRELVRDLAQHFHIRIDMRQIGARDEAKGLGGLAHCGEEYCCTRFGGEFQPVSIRMAKEQDLPLNPAKISGACGRLMCCLRYEYEAYKDFKKRAPKKGTLVATPIGEAVISGYNTPSETMELRLDDGKKLSVPLAEIDCKKEKDGCVSCSINQETIERCATRSMLIALGSLDMQLGELLVTDTEEADMDLVVDTGPDRRRRRRSSKKTDDKTATRTASTTAAPKSSGGQATGTGEKPSQGSRRRKRKSNASKQRNAAQQGASQKGVSQKGASQKKQSQQGARNQNKPGSAAHAQDRNTPEGDARQRTATQNTGEKPRPGQRSSGLRRPRVRSTAEGQATREAPRTPNDTVPDTTPGDTRRRRRRHEGNKE